MSQYLVGWSAWYEDTGSIWNRDTGAIPAGTLGDRAIICQALYVRNESNFVPMNNVFTYANQTVSPVQELRYKTDPAQNAAGQIHLDTVAFNETAIAAGISEGNTNITIDGAGTDNVFIRWCVLEEADQTTPWPSSAYAGYNEKFSGGSAASGGFTSNTLASNAGEAQAFVLMHSGTDRRSYPVTDADWDGATAIEGVNEPCDIVTDLKAAGGEVDYYIEQNLDDSNVTLLCALAFSSPIAAGPSTNPINGDDIVRSGATETMSGTNLGNVTNVQLEGVDQEDLVITSTEISWTTVNKGTPDIPYGTGKTVTFVDGVNGNFTRTVELKPQEGRSYGTVAGLPVTPPAQSVFETLDYENAGGVSNGDIYEVDDFDSNGLAVTFNANGTYNIAGLGERQSVFWTDCYMANNSNQYLAEEVPVYTNIGPVIETLNGEPIASASVTTEATNLQFRGFNCGAVTGKCWFLPDVFNGERPVKNGTEVEQTVSNWTDEGFDVADITWGNIPPGTDLAFIVEKA